MPTGIYLHKKPSEATKLKMSLAKKGKNPRNMEWLQTVFNKGRKRPNQSGENHQLWKKRGVSYRSLHKWVQRHLGKAEICSVCGSSGGEIKKCHWANIDEEYKRKLEDFISLCPSCHNRWDTGNLPINLFEWQNGLERRLV